MSAPRTVFILSTGRSGTTSIADMLGALPGAVIAHELRPKLLREAIEYRRGRFPHSDFVALLRETRAPLLLSAHVLAGESNQRLSFVLPALAESFPDARYVLLHRDGREVVDSLHHRLWYHPREAFLRHPTLQEWAETRFDGSDFGMSASQWSSMSAFARCAWYWALVPRLVREDAARLGLHLLEIRLEDLADSRSALESFLALPTGSLAAPPRSNATTSRRPSWRAWSPRMRRDFERHAGAEMDGRYPGWRSEFHWTAADEMYGALRRITSVARLAHAHVNAMLGRNTNAPITGGSES